MRPWLFSSLILASVLFGLGRPASGAENGEVLWQVGINDNNFHELLHKPAIDQEYLKLWPEGLTFEIGRDDPKTAWLFVQPGTADAWAGQRPHTHRILFDLGQQPRADVWHELVIDLVDAHSALPPALKISVNGQEQTIQLEKGVSDSTLNNPANGREQTARVYVRGAALREKSNVVELTVLRGSWVLYDAITMRQADPPPLKLVLKPTFLFKNDPSGLCQVIEADFELYEPMASVTVLVKSERGAPREQTFNNLAPGRQNLELLVPEVAKPEKVTAELTVGGRQLAAEATVTPQRHWKIYLMPASHYDLGYTGLQPEVLQVQRENEDYAMGLIDQYPGFVWNMDGAMLAEDYLSSGVAPRRFADLARQGRLGPMGLYANMLTSFCSSEELVRLGDCHDALARDHGIKGETAQISDVPSLTGTLPTIMAGRGIKYFSHGVNAVRGDYDPARPPLYYWQAPDKSRVLMWYAGGYGHSQAYSGMGNDGTLEVTRGAVNAKLKHYSDLPNYPYDAILEHGGYADNVRLGEGLPRLAAEWNQCYVFPKLIFCRGEEFFKYVETGFADQIPTIQADGGGWWEDGVGSSAAETAAAREAKEKLVTVEKLAALCGPAFQQDIDAEVDEAWRDTLLYTEHTWGHADSITKPASEAVLKSWEIKKGFADEAAAAADRLLERAMAQFCASVKTGRDSLVVFNPSSWPRSEWVELEDGGTIFAKGVPAMGYKVFRAPRPQPARAAEGNILENRFYRVSFDPATGAIRSLLDKELGRELVDPAQWQMNQYIYVTGGDKTALEEPYFLNYPPCPGVETSGVSEVAMAKQIETGRQVMEVRATAPMAKSFISRVILYDDVKRIDFDNTLDKESNLMKEAGYFAFPLAFNKPQVRIEIPCGVMRPDRDLIAASCNQWFAAQQFVTVADADAAVAISPLDAPLLTLQDINRGQWKQELKIENGNVFGYVFNNYWFTNYRASQEGPLRFRFALTSARALSDTDAKRFGESAMKPMVACKVEGRRRWLPSRRARGFVEVEGEGIVLQALKAARFERGTVVRLREMAGRDQAAKLTLPGVRFSRAFACDLGENRLAELPVKDGAIEVSCPALGLATVLFAP